LTAFAAEIAGIPVHDQVEVDGCALVLNGAGLRKILWMRIYVAALYLTERATTPATVLALPGPKRISITALRDFHAHEVVQALTDGIHDNSTHDQWKHLQERVQSLRAVLLALRDGRQGDVLALDYLPDAGTVVRFNGTIVGGPIRGRDFYQALLRVWVGRHAASDSLKEALLGGTGPSALPER
jgi:hypothetical protein